ncbi:hypothetical protein CHUAL_006131 [Chamberlinius hualienensis]
MESRLIKSKDEITTSSLALQLKWEREAKKLRDTLKNNLQHDLRKLYEEKIFSNVTFQTSDNVEIQSHSAILKSRVQRFYRFCSQFGQPSRIQTNIHFKLTGVNGPELHNFLRQVYTREKMEDLEESFVRRLYAAAEIEIDDKVTEIDHQHNPECEIENGVDELSGGCEENDNCVIRDSLFTGGNESLKSAVDVLNDNLTVDKSFSDQLGASNFEYKQECDFVIFGGADCGDLDSTFVDEDKGDDVIGSSEPELLGINVQQSENSESTDLTQTGNDSTRSDAEETLMSSLKTSVELEVSDIRTNVKDGQLIIHSHDSGMSSDSRKLSTSSVGQPTFSPVSENAADSSESLPKDDSLECCLDSLANDEMNESAISIFGVGSDFGETSSQNLSLGATTSNGNLDGQNIYQISSSLPTGGIGGGLSTWRSVFAKRCSWLDEEDDHSINRNQTSSVAAPQRRWSLSSVDVEAKSTPNGKPAAIVSPYNANIDLQLVLKYRKDVDDIPNNNNSSETTRTPDTRSPMSTVSLVPFLREQHRIEERVSIDIGQNSIPILAQEVITSAVNSPALDRSAETGFNDLLNIGPANNNNNNDDVVGEMRSSIYDSDLSSDRIFADGELSTGLASTNICLTPVTDSGVSHTPPPVYMYIDAAECHSPSHLRSKPLAAVAVRGQPKVGEFTSREVPLRRKVLGSVGGLPRRPKSETSVSLFSRAAAASSSSSSASAAATSDDAGKRKRAKNNINKRVSLTFDDDDDTESTRSLEVPSTMNRLTGGSCSKLGEDLLKMFVDEIDPDVTVLVNGKEIKAHKSVLASRCVYFAAAMSGNWVESSGNVIKMTGFSYDAIHFAIYHIYSGASAIPENIDISELASLADMLGFEGLKDVVVLALKMKYCHFFHKPCTGCATTASECLLISASFGLDELQEKCLRWINKHMLKTWPTKSFAALPDELLQKALAATKLDITVESVLDTTLRCDKLASSLPRVKWVEPLHSLRKQLSDACASFLAENLNDVLASRFFTDLRTGHTWSILALEPSLLVAADNLSLNVACKSYVRLTSLKRTYFEVANDDLQSPDVNENFGMLINKIHRQVEHFLIHNANRVVRCAGWACLSLELQNRIKDAAVIVFEFGKPTAAPPRLSSQNKKFTKSRASTSSTASGSPVISYSRSNVNGKALSKSLHITSDEKASTKTGTKAATLPRSFANRTVSTVRKEVNENNKEAIKNTQPNKSLTSNASHSRLQTNGNQTAVFGAQRPKSINLKERSSSVTTKAREKPLTREMSHSSKSLIPNSISLRSSTATLSRASMSNRSKSLSTGGVRSAKSQSTGCSNGHEKENKSDDKKSMASSSRSRMDEVSKTGTKRFVHCKSIDRAGSSSTLKV